MVVLVPCDARVGCAVRVTLELDTGVAVDILIREAFRYNRWCCKYNTEGFTVASGIVHYIVWVSTVGEITFLKSTLFHNNICTSKN